MNYIEKIKGLWRSHEKHAFTTTEIALYFYLLEICNICQWERQFKRNNAKIETDLSISFNTLKNARNKLQQSGLITFKTVSGSPNVTYTLSKFDKVADEVAIEVSDEVTDEVGSEVDDEINKTKLNKTKLKISSMKMLCWSLKITR
jgi:DNA-binding Lrp family transcriptional regulator